jgi:hypothetical protein
MVTAADISAVLITRGDVDLAPILATLPYDDVVIWDARERPNDAACYSRYMAADEARHDVIYFQDDDLLSTAHNDLIAAYQPGMLVGNMPSPWYEREHYDRDGCVLTGAGSLIARGLWRPAFAAYLEHYPLDNLFTTYCDQISGILTPAVRVDLGYQILPQATYAGRINTTTGQVARKRLAMARAIEIREGACLSAS